MKRFKFRLEAVKRLRAAAEKEAMADLARALGRVRELEAAVHRIGAERQSVLQVVDQRLGAGQIDAGWIERHHGDLQRLDAAEEQARRELQRARAAYDEARAVLRRRQEHLRAMDVLEDKARERHDEEVRREEHVAMDEIALLRHGRKQS